MFIWLGSILMTIGAGLLFGWGGAFLSLGLFCIYVHACSVSILKGFYHLPVLAVLGLVKSSSCLMVS